jgi:acetyl esterase
MTGMVRTFIAGLLLAAAVFAETKSDVEFVRRGDTPLTLDAWVPDGPGPFPAVIIVHGGGFVRGDKQTYVKPLFPVLTDAGFAWFTINYRLAPGNRFPDPVHDVEDAVRWVMRNAREYKVDPKRVALIGESAGGHLVSWVAVTSAKQLGLRAVVPIYAPHDLLGRAKQTGKASEGMQALLDIGSDVTPASEAILRKASPYHQVRGSTPPILLIHGTADQQVPYEQSVAMQKKLKAAGVSVDLYTVPDGAHGMGSWTKLPGTADVEWKKYLVAWLKAKLK